MDMRTTRAIAGAVSVMCVLAAAPGADAALCKSKRGKLTVRTTCKKKEKELTAADLPQTPPVETPAPPPAGPRVVDSHGAEVGALLQTSYYGGGATVLREIGTDFYSFGVKRSGFATLDDDDTFFTYLSSDCTGTPYLSAGYGSLSRTTKALQDGLARKLDISEDETTGYYVTEDGAIDRRFMVTSGGSRRVSSVEGAFLDCFPPNEKPVDQIAACDPAKFCNDAPKCFCHLCCRQRIGGYYGNVVAPARSIDMRSLDLTPPFKVVR
jgi:hypothetical protein